MMPAHPCDELLVHPHELQIGPVADAPVGCFDQGSVQLVVVRVFELRDRHGRAAYSRHARLTRSFVYKRTSGGIIGLAASPVRAKIAS